MVGLVAGAKLESDQTKQTTLAGGHKLAPSKPLSRRPARRAKRNESSSFGPANKPKWNKWSVRSSAR